MKDHIANNAVVCGGNKIICKVWFLTNNNINCPCSDIPCCHSSDLMFQSKYSLFCKHCNSDMKNVSLEIILHVLDIVSY